VYPLKHPRVDVRIDRFNGGVPISTTSTVALPLALVWKGCSQATSHPTTDSGHPDVTEQPLADALTVVINHLQQTIYQTAGMTLLNEVMRATGP